MNTNTVNSNVNVGQGVPPINATTVPTGPIVDSLINIPEINIRTVLRSIIDSIQVIVNKLADLFAYCLRMLVQSEYFILF